MGNDKAGTLQQLASTGVPQLQVHEWSGGGIPWGTERLRKLQWNDHLSPGEKKKELEKGEKKLSLLCGIFHVFDGGSATSARYNILAIKQFTRASQHKFTWVP